MLFSCNHLQHGKYFPRCPCFVISLAEKLAKSIAKYE